MVKGFEELTCDLTDYELTVIRPRIADMLRAAVGRENAITNKQIVERLKKDGYTIGGPRVRGVIHDIRVQGSVKLVLATSDGYFVSKNSEEIDDYIESLNSRIVAIRSVRSSIIRQMLDSHQPGDLFGGVSCG